MPLVSVRSPASGGCAPGREEKRKGYLADVRAAEDTTSLDGVVLVHPLRYGHRGAHRLDANDRALPTAKERRRPEDARECRSCPPSVQRDRLFDLHIAAVRERPR